MQPNLAHHATANQATADALAKRDLTAQAPPSNGEKLCGGDAVAWCDATDMLREEAGDVDSQAVCDKIRE